MTFAFAGILLLFAPAVMIAVVWLIVRPFTNRHREIQRRYSEGLCLNCGYDLRANPQGRCPECGKLL
jgi:hypothetical protein